MGVVRSVFLNDQQARVALERLRASFSDDRITMRSFQSPKAESGAFDGDYDPIGSARLAGTAVATLPATGATLVGNSTTLDLSLGETNSILAMVAAGERRGQYRRSSIRIVATVEVDTQDEADIARDIMAQCGGRELTLDKRNIPNDEIENGISEPTTTTNHEIPPDSNPNDNPE